MKARCADVAGVGGRGREVEAAMGDGPRESGHSADGDEARTSTDLERAQARAYAMPECRRFFQPARTIEPGRSRGVEAARGIVCSSAHIGERVAHHLRADATIAGTILEGDPRTAVTPTVGTARPPKPQATRDDAVDARRGARRDGRLRKMLGAELAQPSRGARFDREPEDRARTPEDIPMLGAAGLRRHSRSRRAAHRRDYRTRQMIATSSAGEWRNAGPIAAGLSLA